MIEFIRSVDFTDLEYLLESLPYLVVAVLFGLVGYPLAVHGINKLTNENS